MDKFLLVDGHHLLFRMFFGMPARITGKDGNAIHAVVGFTGALLKVLSALGPTHVCVLFDSEAGSFRKAIQPDYKGNRPDFSDVPAQENPFMQLGGIKDCLDYLGIRHFETTGGYEADDVIAAYALQAHNMHTVILSSDKDFYQLVNETISVYGYGGKHAKMYDEKAVYARYGIAPSRFADYLSLVGDTADHIQGIPMVGPKTAKRLLDTYGDIDGIIKNSDTITPASLKNRLLQHHDVLLRNKAMVQLDGQAPLPCPIGNLAVELDTAVKTMDVMRATGNV